jgi:hypothetical protein
MKRWNLEGQGVPLPDGEEAGDEGGDVVEEESNSCFPMEDGHPCLEDGSKAHGLYDLVYPGMAKSYHMKESRLKRKPASDDSKDIRPHRGLSPSCQIFTASN